MPRLTQSRYTRTPLLRAERYLAALVPHADAFAELAVQCAGHLIVVSLRRAQPSDRLCRLLSLHWLPQAGPAPTFSGHLLLDPRPSVSGSTLTLDGEYVPRTDAYGGGDDGTLMRRLAQTIADAVFDALTWGMGSGTAASG